MAFITDGLTDTGLGKGVTSHFAFSYDDALNSATHPGQPEPARTNAVIAAIEGDYNLMAGWFGGIGLTLSEPISVQVANAGGGAGWGPPITLKPGGGDANLMRYLMVAEVTEMFMLAQNKGWFAPDGSNEQSSGEGLSHFLATQFLITNGIPPSNDISNLWLNSTRDDFINHIDEYDHSSGPKSGCALLFIYYLNVQLGFSIQQIIAAAAPELSGVYDNVTGDPGNPFPFFKQLLDTAFPGTSGISTGPNFDNPYPLGMLSFWVDKSTFGRDEVSDVIAANGGKFLNAFWLVVEGFSANSFLSLGGHLSDLSGSFAAMPGVTITQSSTTPMDFENLANPAAPQRIRIAFDIKFTSAALVAFPQPGDAPVTKDLDASLRIGGNVLGGSNAAALFEFVGGADPYFTNIDPSQENVFWLSQDLRVLTAVPGQHNVPVSGGPTFPADNVPAAFTYIQSLLTHLNSNYSNPNGNDPFQTVLPSQLGALTGDSSVAPYTVDLSDIFHPHVYNNYNFAVARVRLKGSSAAPPAQNVRVFFRLWSTQTADTDYDTVSTYPSDSDASGLPSSPKVGAGHHTIPFFATGNLAGNTDYVAGGFNNREIQVTSGDGIWVYYGCFLNIYDASNLIDGQPIQHWLNGTHHCLVAQIAYDDAPIINANGTTASPEHSDKLAQRNLQLTHSDNPGPAAAHRIPQTFDIRPSATPGAVTGAMLDYPDELMIDWGKVPVGSSASIYWPQVYASDVLKYAERIHGSHLLTVGDTHTILCKTGKGPTYVPIPPGAGENFAGLLTIDLPQGIIQGSEFNVVVRRVATRRANERVIPGKIFAGLPPNERPAINIAANMHLKHEKAGQGIEVGEAPHSPVAPVRRPKNWRYVVGTFQVKIPVSTASVFRFAEENTLAIMKWRLASLSGSDRWHPVLERYVSYVAARVDALGGDSKSIQPSISGIPVEAVAQQKPRCEIAVEVSGKVVEIIFDCFGRLEAIVLADCCGSRLLKTREREIGEIALRAFQHGLLISLSLDKESHIQKIAIR